MLDDPRNKAIASLVDSGKVVVTDQKVDRDIEGGKFINTFFERLVAKEKKFSRCDFRYCNFSDVYLRKCQFDDCDFTGARFSNSNLVGTTFRGCKFDYADFRSTFIENEILSNCCPDRENLKLKFARSLRTNYQTLGDAKSANKAMNVELAATEEHYRKSWKSNSQYYRRKYTGFKRVGSFLMWLDFKVWDFVWGNGESVFKLLRAVLLILGLIAVIDIIYKPEQISLLSVLHSVWHSWMIFLSVERPGYLGGAFIGLVFFLRLLMFALFISILVKRLSRR